MSCWFCSAHCAGMDSISIPVCEAHGRAFADNEAGAERKRIVAFIRGDACDGVAPEVTIALRALANVIEEGRHLK
jgi:hypothetical protein